MIDDRLAEWLPDPVDTDVALDATTATGPCRVVVRGDLLQLDDLTLDLDASFTAVLGWTRAPDLDRTSRGQPTEHAWLVLELARARDATHRIQIRVAVRADEVRGLAGADLMPVPPDPLVRVDGDGFRQLVARIRFAMQVAGEERWSPRGDVPTTALPVPVDLEVFTPPSLRAIDGLGLSAQERPDGSLRLFRSTPAYMGARGSLAAWSIGTGIAGLFWFASLIDGFNPLFTAIVAAGMFQCWRKARVVAEGPDNTVVVARDRVAWRGGDVAREEIAGVFASPDDGVLTLLLRDGQRHRLSSIGAAAIATVIERTWQLSEQSRTCGPPVWLQRLPVDAARLGLRFPMGLAAIGNRLWFAPDRIHLPARSLTRPSVTCVDATLVFDEAWEVRVPATPDAPGSGRAARGLTAPIRARQLAAVLHAAMSPPFPPTDAWQIERVATDLHRVIPTANDDESVPSIELGLDTLGLPSRASLIHRREVARVEQRGSRLRVALHAGTDSEWELPNPDAARELGGVLDAWLNHVV